MESKSLALSLLLYILLVLLMSFHRCVCVHAQMSTEAIVSFEQGIRDSMKPSFSVVVMVVAFVSVFILTGFFSKYYRHCYNSLLAATRNVIFPVPEAVRPRRRQEVIDECPILTYSEATNPQNGTASVDCAVCLGEFQNTDKIRLLPKCRHAFHPDCIDQWFASRLTCPVCRTPLITPPDSVEIIDVEAPPPPSNPEGNGDDDQNQSEAEINTEVIAEPPAPAPETAPLPAPARIGSSSGGSGSTGPTGTPIPTHSGHSLYIAPDETMVGYTLRLLEQVRDQIAANRSENTQASTRSDVVFPGMMRLRREWWRIDDEGEGSSRTGCGQAENNSETQTQTQTETEIDIDTETETEIQSDSDSDSDESSSSNMPPV